MNIVSLTTDFGLQDNFVGVMKAVILKINPQVKIVDISHGVSPQDIRAGAFLLSNSFRFFPPGTVHLVVVDPGVGSRRKKIIVRTKDYYFVAPDNGVLALALKGKSPSQIIEITNQRYFLKPASSTFNGRDIFAPVAAYLSKGENIAKFGKRINAYQRLNLPKIKITAKSLTGEIIHVDRFGNLISNIDKQTLFNFIKNKKFQILLKDRSIGRLSGSYLEGVRLKPIALIDSFDCLEIALNFGSAEDYFGGNNKGAAVKVVRS